jgi:hypothetical protein
MQKHYKILVAAVFATACASAQAASLTSSGYSENFDSMGTSGTLAPNGWRVLVGPSGTSNITWTSSISDSGVAAMINAPGALVANNAPTATNNNGYNAANGSATSDRLIATSPTTVSGAALELTLTNNTGYSFSELLVSYDTRRFRVASVVNELPGYQLFYSLNNSTWANVSALNPTISTVPNTIGITSVTNANVNLGASVAVGQNLYLRWVDDNADQTSPDQIIGLNNVSITAVPEPESFAMLLAGLGMVSTVARRRKK